MFEDISYSLGWLVLAITLLIIEATTFAIVTVWFAIGALFALIGSYIGLSILYQLTIFVIISGFLLYFTRPIVKKYLNVKTQKTNADRVIGQYAEVIEPINNSEGMGQVKIFGQMWSAITQDDQEILVGEKVKVLNISGVKLIVEKKKLN